MRAIAVNLARLLAAGALVGAAGVLVIYISWRFFYPYAQEWEARGEVARLQRQVNALETEHQRLQQQARLLATPEGIKIEARRLGLLKPGERSLRFMTRPQPRESSPLPERASSEASEPLHNSPEALSPPPKPGANDAKTRAQPHRAELKAKPRPAQPRSEVTPGD